MDEGYDLLFKIITIGDPTVGKTSLLQRFAVNEFTPHTRSTIGVDFVNRTMDIYGVKVRAQVWDTAGHEKFRSIISSYYRGVRGVLFVYDITNEGSFEHIANWVEDFRHHTDVGPVGVLVGNKCDMEEHRQVTTQMGQDFATANDLDFIETSAMDTTNVEVVFERLMKKIIDTSSISGVMIRWKLVVDKGRLYNPASNHYPGEPVEICCDRCRRKDLSQCYGFGQDDLCVKCMDEVRSILRNAEAQQSVPKMSPRQALAKKEQESIRLEIEGSKGCCG